MYAFVHIPKTAGSTFRHILRCSFGARHCDIRVPRRRRDPESFVSADDLKSVRRIYPNLMGIAGHRVTSFSGLEQAAPGIRYFTFLRDPCARLISHFRYARRLQPGPDGREDFIRFCADPRHRNLQTRWLCGSDDAKAAIAELETRMGFVGLTEQFDESLVMFGRWLGMDGLQMHYRSRNQSDRPPGLSVLEDAELRSHLLEANQADTQVYRHVVGNVFPRQKAGYGPQLAADVEALRIRNETLKESRESIWSKAKRNLIYKQLLYFGII